MQVNRLTRLMSPPSAPVGAVPMTNSMVFQPSRGRLRLSVRGEFCHIRVEKFSGTGGVWSYVRTFGETSVPYLTDDAH